MSEHTVDRRGFLKATGGVAASTAAVTSGTASLTFSPSSWAEGLKAFNAHEAKTLLAVARQIFPHPSLADMYYANVIDGIDADASANPDTAKSLTNGIADLDKAMGVNFVDLSPGNQLALLEANQDSPVFTTVKGKSVVALYNNPLVWRHFGYEGASAEEGGYINRGFDDLRWLDNPPKDASPPKA